MSFFLFDDPIQESERSILNNSVCDNTSSNNKRNSKYDYYDHPLASAGFPGYYYGYLPYAYHPQAQASAASAAQKATPKSSINAGRRQSSYNPFDKDVYKLVDFRPKNNLCEDDKNYYIQIDLPGMSKEQIHMELSEDNIITISGERPKKHTGMKISKMECEYGKFSRSFSVPETANIEKIEAKMENGVLEVIIPKAEAPKTQRRTIQVQ